MIDNVLIAKIVGGVSVLGGSGGVVYAYSDVLKNYFFDTSIRSYLVKEVETPTVNATAAATSSVTAPSANLYENNTDKKKLFSCELTSSKEVDESCDLFELTEKAKGYTYLKDLNSVSPKKSLTFSKDKYYKLTIDTSKFSKWNEEQLPTIEITGTSKSKISSLKLLLRTDKIKKDTKTNIVIATLDAAVTSGTTLDLSKAKCKIGTPQGADVSCSLIYKINEASTDISTMDFSKLAPITSLTSSEGVQGHFFIISFDEKDTSKLIFEKDKNKIVISQDNKTASLTFSSFVFNKLEETSANNNVVVIDELKVTPA